MPEVSEASTWNIESDRDALVPASSSKIPDRPSCRPWRGLPASRFITAALSVSVVALSLLCACLAVVIIRLLPLQPPPCANSPPTHCNTTAMSAEISAFPLAMDFSRSACNNRGIQYAREGCQCFACFSGSSCQESTPLADCNVAADGGTPLLFEEYWVQHPGQEVRIRASDHLGYQDHFLPRLEAAIRAIHALAGNAVTEGKRIVIGPGSSAVISAALLAYGAKSADTTHVYAAKPYYSAYPLLTQYSLSGLLAWAEAPPVAAEQPVVELVTSPNNPDGSLRSRTVPGAMVLYDHAYYWPHFTPITGPVDYNQSDVAVFTLSKLSGHAGSRVGWAIVTDEALADSIQGYTLAAMPVENQIRATVLLEHILGTQGELFGWAGARMKARWDRLSGIFAATIRFSTEAMQPEAFDEWTGTVRQAWPAYLWMRCLDSQRDTNCTKTLEDGGIVGRPGARFGSPPEYARLELLMRQEEFDFMAAKLESLAEQ